jgi:hypothetical protein
LIRGHWLALAWLLAACSKPSGGGSPATSAGGGPAVEPEPSTSCAGDPIAVHRRLVRLTTRQITTSVQQLISPELALAVAQKYDVPDISARAFPPLSSQQEGTFVTDGLWAKSEGIAKAAGEHVRDNYASVTGCDVAATTDDCAIGYVMSLAERAFRRPLHAEDSSSLLQVFTESRSFGAGVVEAVQHAVWAVLSSPHFLYRRELGNEPASDGSVPLTGHELATALSFFLTDGPPDTTLLEAAAAGALTTPEGLGVQVDRLLGTEEVRANLRQAVFTYFGIGNLDAVIIDPARAPTFTVGLKNAMYRESQDFLNAVLYGGGPVGELLTSRITVVNRDLAALYGIEFSAGPEAASDTFVSVELPATRAGLLSQAGFLTARARPDKDSVVARGLLIAATMLCASNPDAPPEGLKDEIAAAEEELADKTEREKSEHRVTEPSCGVCHGNFDAYGLVLENFDLIGQYRPVDAQGRAIDASVTLPADVGGALVNGVAEMGRALSASGVFTTCLTRNLMKYALAEGNVNRDDCAVQHVSQRVLSGKASFPDLVREIALSKTFGTRAGKDP